MGKTDSQALPDNKEREETGDPHNEVEITLAGIDLNKDRTIVIRLYSIDIPTRELITMAEGLADKYKIKDESSYEPKRD